MLVGLLVLSSVAMPMLPYLTSDGVETRSNPVSSVGSADAQTITASCTVADWIGADSYCDTDYDTSVENNLDHLQTYQTGLSKIAAADVYRTTFENYVLDTEDIAFLVAERSIYDSINNGDSKILAQSKAQVAIQEYHQSKKYNYIQFWNQHAVATNNLAQTTPAAINIPNIDSRWNFVRFEGLRNETITFDKINETVTLEKFAFYAKSDDGDDTSTVRWDPINGKQTGIWDVIGGTYQINLVPPSPEDGATTPIVYASQWEAYDELDRLESETIEKMENYTDATYSEFESGNLNASEILSQVNQINNLLADVDTENGDFNTVTSYLAASGMTTPDLDNTSYMSIRYQEYRDSSKSDLKGNQTLDGLIASTSEPPTGSWQVGQTYDTENLDGSQSVALVEGGMAQLNGEFEIQEVYNESGGQVYDAEIQTTTRDYQIEDVSDLNNRTQQLQKEIDKLQEIREESSGGGALFGDLGSISLPGLGDVPVLGAIAGGIASVGGFVLLIVLLLIVAAIAS